MDFIHDLSDIERKIITIIQNNNKRGRSPSLKELEMRSGHNVDEIKRVITDLVKRKWIVQDEGKLVVTRRLF